MRSYMPCEEKKKRKKKIKQNDNIYCDMSEFEASSKTHPCADAE